MNGVAVVAMRRYPCCLESSDTGTHTILMPFENLVLGFLSQKQCSFQVGLHSALPERTRTTHNQTSDQFSPAKMTYQLISKKNKDDIPAMLTQDMRVVGWAVDPAHTNRDTTVTLGTVFDTLRICRNPTCGQELNMKNFPTTVRASVSRVPFPCTYNCLNIYDVWMWLVSGWAYRVWRHRPAGVIPILCAVSRGATRWIPASTRAVSCASPTVCCSSDLTVIDARTWERATT